MRGRNIFNSESTLFYLVFDEMTIDSNMFCRVVHNTDSWLVVTKQSHRVLKLEFQFSHDSLYPHKFTNSICHCSIFCLITTSCNHKLFFAALSDQIYLTIVRYPICRLSIRYRSSPICICECVYLSIIMFGEE